MRILHLTPYLSGGGAEQQLHYLSAELANRGHDVSVAYLRDGPSRQELARVKAHRLIAANNHSPRLLWQLVKLIKRIRPDIIGTWMLQMDILGGVAARLTQTPWVLHEQSSAQGYSSSWKTRLRVRVGATANGIVSNSVGGDDYWKRQLPNTWRCIVRNGLLIGEIATTPTALVARLVKPDLPIVLYVGRLTSDRSGVKNLPAFIKALACVSLEQEVLGIVCGEGPQRLELEALAHRLRLDGWVHFTGHLPSTSVWALMKSASLFVSLSAYEGCPNAVMEALACECPVILSDIPAHRELVDERSAVFTDPTNIEEIARAIVLALRSEETTRARAFIAKEKVKDWSVSEMGRRYERVYEEAISRYSERSPQSGVVPT